MSEVEKQLFRQYLAVHCGLKPNSLIKAISGYNVYFRYINDKNLEHGKDSVDQFFYEKINAGTNNNTLNSYAFFTKKYYDYLNFKNIPTEDFRIKTFKKFVPPIYPLTVEECLDLINCELERGVFRGKECLRLNPLYSTITALLATTGLRIEEALKLEIRHLDFANRTATIETSKNNEPGIVYLNDDLVKRLGEEIGDRKDGYVFTSMTGKKITVTTYREELVARAKKLGIKKRVYPHLFRHTFATLLHNKGLTLVEIQALTRHKDIKSLARYIHMADDKNRSNAMKHPLNQQSMDTSELLEDDVLEAKNLKAFNDKRFDANINYDVNEGYVITVKKKKPLNLQTSDKTPTHKD